MSNNIENIMNVTLEKIKEMVDSNTVVGKPIISPDGTTLIPISKISYGFASGGSDFASKNNYSKDLFGGGSGAGITVQPVAFIAISNGDVKMLQIESFSSATDRVISMIPDIIDKLKAKFKKDKKKDSEESIDEIKDIIDDLEQ